MFGPSRGADWSLIEHIRLHELPGKEASIASSCVTYLRKRAQKDGGALESGARAVGMQKKFDLPRFKDITKCSGNECASEGQKRPCSPAVIEPPPKVPKHADSSGGVPCRRAVGVQADSYCAQSGLAREELSRLIALNGEKELEIVRLSAQLKLSEKDRAKLEESLQRVSEELIAAQRMCRVLKQDALHWKKMYVDS